MPNNQKNYKVAFTGGGTGGHIYPNLAVIEELHNRYPETKIYYLGNPEKLEAKLLKNEELKDFAEQSFKSYTKFIDVHSEPLMNIKNPLRLFGWMYNFRKNTLVAQKELKKNQIDVVFGTGGYAAGPVFSACSKLKIPYIIHNLDAYMGLANRVFVRQAHTLTLGIQEIGCSPKNKRSIITGNPISKKFSMSLQKTKDEQTNKSQTQSPFKLLITGGSQGAKDLNSAVGQILPELNKLQIHITHITGEKLYQDHIQEFLDGKPNKFTNYTVLPYTHEMPELCGQADLAVCRAGAMTIAEMIAAGVVPIFVPLPWAAHNHQELNAQALASKDAALILHQGDKNFASNLLEQITQLIENTDKLEKLKNNLESISKNNAREKITELLLECVGAS